MKSQGLASKKLKIKIITKMKLLFQKQDIPGLKDTKSIFTMMTLLYYGINF